jgi:hypothetical protein
MLASKTRPAGSVSCISVTCVDEKRARYFFHSEFWLAGPRLAGRSNVLRSRLVSKIDRGDPMDFRLRVQRAPGPTRPGLASQWCAGRDSNPYAPFRVGGGF